MSDRLTSHPNGITGSRTARHLPVATPSEECYEQSAPNSRKATTRNIPSLRRYAVTYAFTDYMRGESRDVPLLITETIAAMRHDGIDIEFLGATQEIDAEGRLTEVTARYAAPSKGTIGRLNCRACLPASGPPRSERSDTSDSMSRRITVANY